VRRRDGQPPMIHVLIAAANLVVGTQPADLLQRRELEPFSTLGEFPKDRSSRCNAVCSKTYEADIALQESGMLQPKYPVLGFQALRKKWTRDNMHASAHARAIPVVGVALIRDEVGMVLRTLYSIDVPVEHIVIIVGPGEASAHAVVLNHIKLFIANVTLVLWNKNAYPSPSETWNAATRAFPRAAWILHVAPDTTFMPGSLAVLSERMFAASASELSIIAYARYTVPFGAIFNAFAMTREFHESCGLFDENIYPAYFEDTEMVMRVAATQCGREYTIVDFIAMHHHWGEGYISGVANLGAEDKYYTALMACGNTGAYFYTKWGASCDGDLTVNRATGEITRNQSLYHCYNSPFNVTNRPASEWVLDKKYAQLFY